MPFAPIPLDEWKGVARVREEGRDVAPCSPRGRDLTAAPAEPARRAGGRRGGRRSAPRPRLVVDSSPFRPISCCAPHAAAKPSRFCGSGSSESHTADAGLLRLRRGRPQGEFRQSAAEEARRQAPLQALRRAPRRGPPRPPPSRSRVRPLRRRGMLDLPRRRSRRPRPPAPGLRVSRDLRLRARRVPRRLRGAPRPGHPDLRATERRRPDRRVRRGRRRQSLAGMPDVPAGVRRRDAARAGARDGAAVLRGRRGGEREAEPEAALLEGEPKAATVCVCSNS